MRNAESFFSTLPHANISRSRFNMNHSHKTSFDVGELVPFDCIEVLPSDTFEISTAKLVRLQTMITPPMDNMYLDTYWFFVPHRLVWEHWRELMGENTDSAWLPQNTYSVPQLTSPSGGWSVGSIADHFGIPTGVGDLSVNALPIRSYALICQEWFRDENLTDPLVISTGDSTIAGSNGTNYITDVAKGGALFKVAKYHDYFTSALPHSQRGNPVKIPMLGGDVPVVAKYDTVDDTDFDVQSNVRAGLTFYNGSGSTRRQLYNSNGTTVGASDWSSFSTTASIVPNNLWALTSGMVTSATISDLRTAFQLQKMFEADARGGVRYTEIIRQHFGTVSPDSRLQRPEYLGGNRIAINVNQVLQQSETGSTPQGNPTGTSLTTDNNWDFKHSFTEHGYIIGVMCLRYTHSYQYGLSRLWSRKTRYDFYWPLFANLSEQAILNKEIYAQGSSVVDSDGNIVDDQVFGYQERYAEYRYLNNIISGELRSQYAASLDVWHLADKYNSLPSLSDAWIREDKSNVDRVLAVQSSVSNQCFGDFYIKCKATRPMPVYSIPGLIDHH